MNRTNNNAAGVLAKAFQYYPLMQYAFEGLTEQRREVLLNNLYSKCVSAASLFGGVLNTPDGQGSVIWLPGKNFQLGLVHEIRAGMALIPFQIGIKPTLRLLKHDAEAEGWVRKNASKKMGYIWCIGVLPEVRGRGYSHLLIDQSIAQMRSLGLTECWLKTEDSKNVTIYQKSGFTLMNEMRVKSSGISSWAMKKEIQ